MDDRFVSGLVCGEGNFTIAISKSNSCRLGYHIRPIFQIELHHNDAPLLEMVRDYFGFGGIHYPKPRTGNGNKSPSCKYVVTALSDCMTLSRFFTENPLIGIKHQGFVVWTECLAIIELGEHTSSEGFERIVRMRDQINHTRHPLTYRDHHALTLTAKLVDSPRKLATWSRDEESLINDYLGGAITRQELQEATGRRGASLDNKVSRMRKAAEERLTNALCDASSPVSELGYDVAWTTKYRLKVLIGDVADDLETLIRGKATVLEVEIKHLAIKPDHVHLFVSAPPEYSPSKLANQFKGYSSRRLREKYRHLVSRMPALWSRSFYVGSAGHVSDKTIARYIASQETRSK